MGQLTFQSLCKRLKNKPSFGNHVEKLNIFIGAAACLIGEPTAGGAAMLIKILAEKEKLISLGKLMVEAILDQPPSDYSGRVEQMEEAYGTIYFTAFFDELDRQLPDNIRKQIGLKAEEKRKLFEDSALLGNREHLDRREIIFPDIVSGRTAVDANLLTVYRSMSLKLWSFVKGLSLQGAADTRALSYFKDVMNALPDAAVQRFHDQYLVLCGKFNEFYIYAQMEREAEREIKWETRYQEILAIATRAGDSAEAGLAGLKTILDGIPGQIKKEQVRQIVDGLIDTYQGGIDRPIIETKGDEEKLTYPRIRDAFIPQAYKLLRYTGKERLERNETWEELEPGQNLQSFWAKYCLDPGSVEGLLLILGEPGGGKSLLTKILCARTINSSNICVRIPLREHDVEHDIEAIICKQIERDGDAAEPVPTFKWFAEEFRENPVTLLFDGYDEVMQATGGVYRNLLTKIRQFQDRCREQRRPVRIVVTSRETLIDKADIPKGTTVMKLLEFDEARKAQWIEIWNAQNHRALAKAGIRDFSLPKGNSDIEALSGQPFLLLMLAIYDANFETKANALKQAGGQAESLDRTRLYDELLRRFIRRELRKGPRGQDGSYDEANETEQNDMVDEEMKKLGIAALGMFVREKLSLKVGELEDDLAYMKAKAVNYSSRNRKMLKNAEAVFGSFFFIHDSRREDEEDEKEAAFEFLHKTFYEFLAADLILHHLIDAADKISEQKHSSRRGEAYYWEALERPDFLGDAYYAVLNSACLCTEPEIIRMIAEWKNDKLKQYFQGESPDFDGEMAQVLAHLFDKHAGIIRTGVFTPFVDQKGGLAGGREYPQACAVYLMNLIILRILTGGKCRINRGEWSYISQFLKLNIPQSQKKAAEPSDAEAGWKLEIDPYEEMVLKFMALFQLRREDEDIVLTRKPLAGKLEQETLQEARTDVFDFLQDDVTRKVYQLHDTESDLEEKQQHRRELTERGFDLSFEMAAGQLNEVLHNPEAYGLEGTIRLGITWLERGYADQSLVLNWLLCVQLAAGRLNPWENITYALEDLGSILFHRYPDDPEILLTFLEIVKTRGCGEILLRGHRMLEKLERWSYTFPDAAVAFVEAVTLDSTADKQTYINWVRHYSARLKHICVQCTDHPNVTAALLKLFYRTGTISPADFIVRDIMRQWNKYFSKSPEQMPSLLRVYLEMGMFEEVKAFLQYTEQRPDWIRVLLNQHPKSVNEFLNIAQVVGEERSFVRFVAQYKPAHAATLHENPDTVMEVTRQLVSKEPSLVSGNLRIEYFLDQYNVMFHSNPKAAVSLLLQIASDRNRFGYDLQLFRAYRYSFSHYSDLLDASGTAAARLLTLYEKLWITYKKRVEKRNLITEESPAFYAELSFNKAISAGDKAVASALAEFLDTMSRNTRTALEGYFRKQLPYLQWYSQELGEKVQAIYGLA